MTQEPKVINFMGMRKIASAFSILLVIASIVSLAVNGLKLGLDFTGGTQMEVGFEQPADIPKIRSILVDEGLESPVAVLFGSESEVLIRTQGSMQDGALIKIERELSAIGEDINVAAVERAPREKERFAHELLVSNVAPDQLQQAGVFSESGFGEVEFEARGADTAVVVERTLDSVYTTHLLTRLSNEAGSTAE